MKKTIFALFDNIDVANNAINKLHNQFNILSDDISYVYKNKDGQKVSGTNDDTEESTAAEGAVTGATTGGIIGATVGLIAVAGLLGPLGPIVVAGPLATFLGITGATGAVIGTGIAGATIGGLVGALMSMGVSEPQARNYETRVDGGDVLVSITAENTDDVTAILREFDAKEITVVEKN